MILAKYCARTCTLYKYEDNQYSSTISAEQNIAEAEALA